jgi:uncharacterized protein
MNNPVGWFEIPVTDMERAKKFYSTVFEVEFTDMPMPDGEMAAFPMEMGAPQAAGALLKHEMYKPSPDGVRIYFSAPDINVALERVEANGGKIVRPEFSIGEHGFVGVAADTEGNVIALHRRA